MKRYFDGCHTAEELKKEYRKLAKELHPDRGGNAEDFAAMQNEFEKAWEILKDTHTTKEGKTYTSTEQTTESAEEFMDIINKMVTWNVSIEIIGTWLWVSGDTYNHRDELKQMHFGFSGKKKAWYFHRDDYKKRTKKHFDLDDLRHIYGSEEVKTRQEEIA